MDPPLKHYMGHSSMKVQGKFGRILRIEITTNDVSSFRQHRTVRQKDGQIRFRLAPVCRTICSFNPGLRHLLAGASQRYLAFLPAVVRCRYQVAQQNR
ncbi:MAG TPA: hypothetical protein VMK12_02855 [Anaeromyxobacteraceae bacterium]|nr:hypothetical protein [Anaeromyxobacteraceae bacterium]